MKKIYIFSKDPQKGIALILVLWVLALLMVIVLSFSYASRTETAAAMFFKQNTEKKFLAEAGIERGIVEVVYRLNNLYVEGNEVLTTDGAEYTFHTDNGYYTISITDESGKVDINRTPEVILRNMLGNLGLEIEHIDIIVDSIMDWKDDDDLYRLHGAESDYYMSLPNPYMPKDADFETLEELILVKGVTPEILYGDDEKSGIIDFLTVNSTSGKINLNAAPEEVLLSIPGMSSDIVDAIMINREAGGAQNITGIAGQNYSAIKPYVNMNDSNTFTIESTGYKNIDKIGYSIRATVNVFNNGRYQYIYYKSPVKA